MDPLHPLEASQSFDDEVFLSLELERADLRDKEFYRCVFRGAKLQESRWRGCRFEECTFEDCDLTRMQPMGIASRGVSFLRCKLMGVSWKGLSDFPQLKFEGCLLRYSSFVDLSLKRTPFLACNILEATFQRVDLAESTFTDSELTGSSFRDCDLRGANFSGCRGLFIDPSQNRVKGAQVPIETAVRLAELAGMRVDGLI